eukprot:gene232-421_t
MKKHSVTVHNFSSRICLSKDFHSESMPERSYTIFSAEAYSRYVRKLQDLNPSRFTYHEISWGKFPDGTDNITMAGFQPENLIAGRHILFFASFNNNDVTLSQFSVLIVLLQSFIDSLTIVLPFYPVGTMERVESEGKVATANTYAVLLSSLPSCGKPIRLMIYDIHALQERFYFHGSTIPSLHSSIPLLLARLEQTNITTVVFPDDGAAKRFGGMFSKYQIIVCGKVRDGLKRIVKIADGDPTGRNMVIVDDLVQSGGTLQECAEALRKEGALEISAFVAHGVFPNSTWQRFCRGYSSDDNKDRVIFEKFWITNSIPSVTSQLPEDDVFEVLDLLPQIVTDVDAYGSW